MRTINDLKLTAEEERKFQETKQALEKEIHKRFVKELVLRSQRQTTTPEQQAYLEQLYFDLKFINPELAFATLKASALITARAHELSHKQNPSDRKKVSQDDGLKKQKSNIKTSKPPVATSSTSKSKSKSSSKEAVNRK